MKKLGKKELEIVVKEISNEISKIKKEKVISSFEGSEEGKRMRELEKSIGSKLEVVNEELMEMRDLKKKFVVEKLKVREDWSMLELDEKRDVKFGGGFSVEIRVGVGYGGDIWSIREKVEREIILEGLKGEFNFEEIMKRMIEKFS